ncbi:MAG: hypothetical protein IPP57_09095 [Candidatus Obscuribacter sp.]|jgi:hypothetical protein|nr:hypothetical protein [Candidatus Obscuribacter sp.]MBK7840199.1 hypothetical protein [Candidatus Obscuribacter sp.]MBK9204337.1 hypothetical protein [Candidatus Obscuribacter sp.]MBK9770964.1 hypothetical protein [Candidatus Obscuribacter sp.]MBL0186502.1 hypothetical protein [Candidatus Obscuribacter sp.]
MSKLELYINGTAGGYHNLMAVSGARREQVGYSTNDVDEMMRQALTMLESGDYEPQLRVVDPGRIKCRTSDGVMVINLSKLRVWTAPSYSTVAAMQPDVLAATAVPDNEVHYRALGRHLVTN